ncbi:hypothetical protein M430DRAFT_33277 [Amorphotheca resinae ATCC 22711]|uniref:Uncharacterized protein n=1 Tax=Amorphotheca resinae ATCC 22711 TaxID=857342 RepID=A0A2T3BBE3_AMORE|nr:hypothetical protein M430DRAFT_33277 [Amorphotheca resinae ATCC 22711]PSS25645.1 hypothetical protein M430DRAFT_33277 [Amorphotheca resinae ATCC 22711]
MSQLSASASFVSGMEFWEGKDRYIIVWGLLLLSFFPLHSSRLHGFSSVSRTDYTYDLTIPHLA